MIQTSAYDLAQRFIGTKEVSGSLDNPQILAMLKLDGQDWANHDEVPWCSAFVNYIAWLLRLPRSKNLLARSWLQVGRPISLADATTDSDIVILSRGGPNEPGPDVINAPGHVGFFAEWRAPWLRLLAGNQGNQVCIMTFDDSRVLGVRRL